MGATPKPPDAFRVAEDTGHCLVLVCRRCGYTFAADKADVAAGRVRCLAACELRPRPPEAPPPPSPFKRRVAPTRPDGGRTEPANERGRAVVAALREGMSTRDAAARFGIAWASVERLRLRYLLREERDAAVARAVVLERENADLKARLAAARA